MKKRKTMKMEVEAIRDNLRTGKSEDLSRRRKIMALSALGLLDFSLVSLYQTGVIRHLPDLPFALFASDKVNASKDAYLMGVPDGPVSAAAYGLTMIFASAGGSANTGRKPVMDAALGATVAGNTIGAVYYLYNMIFVQKKICLYCLTGAAVNIASAAIIAPTVIKSIRKMFGK